MMPGLLTGDRLVVTKYPYGWSWVSPSFHVVPPMQGRVFGRLPERGDIVIVTPPGTRTDYIKRVIGLPGDVIRMVNGTLIINGEPVKRAKSAPTLVPVDVNSPGGAGQDDKLLPYRMPGKDGGLVCQVPTVRETLPNGRTYDTVELGLTPEDNFGPVRIPAGHLWLMGDNRDDSRQPRPRMAGRPRRPGTVGEYRWPSGVHYFLARRLDQVVEPADLDRGAAPGPRREVAQEQLMATRKAPPTTEPHVERPGPAEFRDPLV